MELNMSCIYIVQLGDERNAVPQKSFFTYCHLHVNASCKKNERLQCLLVFSSQILFFYLYGKHLHRAFYVLTVFYNF